MKIQLFIENPIQTNTWVLSDEETKESIIIDLGGNYKKIKNYINENNSNLKFILCTHGHFDHILGIPEMQKEENIPVFVNKKDDILVKNINELCHTFGLPANLPQVKITDYIDKNSKLEFAHKPIKIFETPGHTQGGLCFQIDNMLFSGDTLFYQGIGRSDLFGGDYNTLINSIKTELLPLPDDIEVFPGHGPKTTIALEKKFNPYLN